MKYTVNQEKNSSRILAGEAIIVNKKTSYFYSLNASGTSIWEMLTNGSATPEEISERLAKHYSLAVSDVSGDVKAFLSKLVSERLIEKNTALSNKKSTPVQKSVKRAKSQQFEAPKLTKFEKLEKMLIAAV